MYYTILHVLFPPLRNHLDPLMSVDYATAAMRDSTVMRDSTAIRDFTVMGDFTVMRDSTAIRDFTVMRDFGKSLLLSIPQKRRLPHLLHMLLSFGPMLHGMMYAKHVMESICLK